MKKKTYNHYFIFKKKKIWNLSNFQLNNSIHFTRPDNGREAFKLNKAAYYSKVKGILSDILTNSVSFILVLINTVDYETIRCYPQNCQKIPLPTSYFSPLIGFNLLLWIKIILSSCMGYQTFINRILLSEIFLNIYSCNLVKILVSFLDSLYRNQFSVKQILFLSSHCNSLSNSNNPSTLLALV